MCGQILVVRIFLGVLQATKTLARFEVLCEHLVHTTAIVSCAAQRHTANASH